VQLQNHSEREESKPANIKPLTNQSLKIHGTNDACTKQLYRSCFMFSKSKLFAVMLGVFSVTSAVAVPLTLVVAPGTVPQSASNPCVIAATNCPSNPITFTTTGNGDFSTTSPIYTYTPGTTSGTSFGFTFFDIAVDSGVAGGNATDTLTSFSIDVRSNSSDPFVSIYTFSGVAGNISNPTNNGNGFADYLLQTADLSTLAAGSQLRFSATLTNETGGPDSFYIVGKPGAPMPVPASVALLGLGLVALGFKRRK
jgi:hypothetical protein